MSQRSRRHLRYLILEKTAGPYVMVRLFLFLTLILLSPGRARAAYDAWTGTGPFATGVGNRGVTALAVDPTDSSIVYAGTESGTVSRYAYAAPAVSTIWVTDVTSSTARVFGDITHLGVSVPMAHGVCWSTSPDPTLGDSFVNNGEVTGTGAFPAEIQGLSPETVYHVRAFVRNTAGTDYGQEMTFVTLSTHTLQAWNHPSAGGTVSRSPDNALYDHGSVVTVTALPSPGYAFTGWTGDYMGSDNPVVLTMTEDKALAAMYDIETYTLSLASSPDAGGSVAHSPDQAVYTYGYIVTVTASAAEGYNFIGWSGDLTGTGNPARIAMDGSKTVTALFSVRSCTLSTVSSPASGGSVIALPDPAACTCGDIVTLTASPSAGYEFIGWSGDLGGADNPAAISMDGDRYVVALFEETGQTEETYYRVDFIAGENGYIAGDTRQTVMAGEDAEPVTAVADPDYVFTGWTGDRTGIDNPLVVSHVQSDMTITALFESRATADRDGDGAADVLEQGPDGSDTTYDGDGDGIPDWDQAAVISLPSVRTGEYVTLSTDSGQLFLDALRTADTETDLPSGYGLAHGIVDLWVKELPEGGDANIAMRIYGTSEGPDLFLVYGPETEDAPAHWYAVAVESGEALWTLSAVDGGPEDRVTTPDGMIQLTFAPARAGDDPGDDTGDDDENDDGSDDDGSSKGKSGGPGCFITAVQGKTLESLLLLLLPAGVLFLWGAGRRKNRSEIS